MPTHRKLFRFRVLLTLSLAYGCTAQTALQNTPTQANPVAQPTPVPTTLPTPAPTPGSDIKLLSVQEIDSLKASGLIAANNRFSWDLFNRLYQQQPENNLFVSPLSAAMALQMTLQGASGDTAVEMRKALGLENIDDASLRQNFPLLMRKLQRPAEDITLEVANSFWAAKKFNFQAEFLATAKTDFLAEVASVDYFDPAVPGRINAWTAKATHDKITKVIDKIVRPDLTVAFLLNAIYFNSKWTHPFDKSETRNKAFRLENGSTVDVPMMRQFSTLPYRTPNESFPHQAIALPYGKEGKLKMYLFLPMEGKTLKDLQADMQNQSFESLRQSFIHEGGSLELPRFKLENKYTLNEPLKAMGMQKGFKKFEADFTRMSPESLAEGMYISYVEQFSYVDLDEEGTEAAAVTVVAMSSTPSSMPMRTHSMIVDHPFLFLIHDEETGQILFMGTVTDPSKLS